MGETRGNREMNGKGTALSMDARALISAWFQYGHHTTVEVGGTDAQSIVSDRGLAAIDELVAAGLVSEATISPTGRKRYTGTPECRSKRLSMVMMEKHGDWSPTIPNPARKGA